MTFFSSVFQHKPHLGIDIGTTSLKIVELGIEKEGIAFKNYGVLNTYGYLERANSALQASTLKLGEGEVVEYLKLLLDHMKTSVRSAVISVPSFSAFSTLIELPTTSPGEIKNVMEFQAKQYVPLPLSEIILDWQKVGERIDGGAKKDQVLLIALVKDHVERMKTILAKTGITLAGIEIEGMGLARSLTAGNKDPVLIIDIGGRSTSMCVAQNGLLKFSVQTDFSGGSLTQTLANGLNISTLRAEDLKIQRGLMNRGGEQELSTLLEVILDVILKEASRAREKYESTYGEKVKSVLLSGGGANLLGIEEYVGKAMDIPVAKADPFKGLRVSSSLEPLLKELRPLLAVSIGMGMKDISPP